MASKRQHGTREFSRSLISHSFPARLQARSSFGAETMAIDKQPRNTAAKKTSQSVTKVPTTSQPVSTSQPAGGTARNPIVTNNAALDLDEVRRRAYELYEQEGHQGNQEEHWFRAEAELRERNGDGRSTSRSTKRS